MSQANNAITYKRDPLSTHISAYVGDSTEVYDSVNKKPYTLFLVVSNKLVSPSDIEYIVMRDTSLYPTISIDMRESALHSNLDKTFMVVPGSAILVGFSDGITPHIFSFTADSVNAVSGTISINGVFRQPEMYKKCSHSIRGNSTEVLEKLSQQMDIGFGTNIAAKMNDAMIWHAPEGSEVSTFAEYIAQHSYYDENTFFNYFIDIFGYAVFVDYVTLTQGMTTKDAFNDIPLKINKIAPAHSDTAGTMEMAGGDNKDDIKDSCYIISNHNSVKGWNNHIDDYSIENRSADAVQSGSATVVEYYDILADKFVSTKIEVLVAEDAEGSVPANKGVVVDGAPEFSNIYEKRRFPPLVSDNHHANYYIAEVQNELNLKALRSNGIRCTMNYNPNIRRGTVIWVDLYVRSDQSVVSEEDENGEIKADDADETGLILDDSHTGAYIIDGIEYVSERGPLQMILHLVRRTIPYKPGEIDIQNA